MCCVDPEKKRTDIKDGNVGGLLKMLRDKEARKGILCVNQLSLAWTLENNRAIDRLGIWQLCLMFSRIMGINLGAED